MFPPSSSLRKSDGSPDSERRSDYASPLPALHFWPAEGGGRRKVTCDVSEKRGGNRYEKYQFASSAKFAEKFLGLVLFCVIHTGVGYSIWNLGKDMGVHVPIF
jgi:hypothetical protein